MKFRRFFWFFVFILAAAWLVASKVFGIRIEIEPWRILVGVVLLYAFIESIIGFSIFGILATLAGLYWLFARYLNLFELHIFPLFGAVVMMSIGIYILTGFGGKRRRHGQCGDGKSKFTVEETKDIDGDDVYRRLNCGQSEVYLHSQNLKKAEFVCFAGDMRIYFSGAQIDPGGASVRVECNMGSLKLFIPKTWKVTENIVVVIGGVDEKNKHENTQYSDTQGGSPRPLLAITGIVRMGAVEIVYV
jgi:predicted membrane protein